MQIKVGIIGSTGGVGKQLKALVAKSSSFEYVGGIDSKKNSDYNLAKLFHDSDVIIDFSTSKIIETILKHAIFSKKPLVIGTTGYNERQFNKIMQASEHIPVFYSSNFSLGMHVLKKLLKILCLDLKDKYLINLIEWHRLDKQDLPSGTAKSLLKELLKYTNQSVETNSIRSGKVFCEHTLSFTNDAERITLKHEVYDKKTFAKTSLDAAAFILSQERGYYEMKDLLEGLKCSK